MASLTNTSLGLLAEVCVELRWPDRGLLLAAFAIESPTPAPISACLHPPPAQQEGDGKKDGHCRDAERWPPPDTRISGGCGDQRAAARAARKMQRTLLPGHRIIAAH